MYYEVYRTKKLRVHRDKRAEAKHAAPSSESVTLHGFKQFWMVIVPFSKH